jgi:hypothetical protein
LTDVLSVVLNLILTNLDLSSQSNTCAGIWRAFHGRGVVSKTPLLQVHGDRDDRRSDGNGGLCVPYQHVQQGSIRSLRCHAMLINHTPVVFGPGAGKVSQWNWTSTVSAHDDLQIQCSMGVIEVSLCSSVILLAVHHSGKGGWLNPASLPRPQTPGEWTMQLTLISSIKCSSSQITQVEVVNRTFLPLVSS